MINSLTPEAYGGNFECVILQYILMFDILSMYSWIVLRWIPQDFAGDKSTLVQVMAWCRQATSHYLS